MQIASLEQVVECKGAEIDQLQFNSEMLEEDHETLLQKFSFQEKQIETLRTENATLKRAVEEEKSASSARVQRAGELEDSVTKLQTQLQAALKGTADVSELMHEKLALQLELKAAKEAHVSQGQLLEHARGQLEVAEAKAREASAKFVSEHEVREQVSKAFAALQERHAKAVAQLEHLTQQSSQAQSALQEAQSDLESRAAEQLRMETRIAELEKALVDAEGARGEEVDKVLQELENYRKQLADADVARHAMHKSNKALEAALADAKREHAAAIQALRESAAHERAAAEVSLAQLRGELAQGREKSSERDAMNEKLVASLRAECQSLRSAMAAAQQDTRAAKAHATTLEARLSEITSLFAASESSSTASVVGGVEASPVRGARQALQVMEAKRSEISRQLAEMRSNHEQEVAFLQAELRAANADKAAAAHAQSAAQADVEQSRKESRELQDKLKALRAELRAKEESFVRLSTDMEKSMQAKNSEMEKVLAPPTLCAHARMYALVSFALSNPHDAAALGCADRGSTKGSASHSARSCERDAKQVARGALRGPRSVRGQGRAARGDGAPVARAAHGSGTAAQRDERLAA
jgi:chromosome segregation ATPase